MRWGVEVEGCEADEGGGEAPGHAYEEETEGPAEDGGGGGWGVGCVRGHCGERGVMWSGG